MAFWQLYFHLVWATYRREPFLTERIERQVYGTILNKAKELGCKVHAIGGVEDHIHLAISIPPKHAIAEIVRQLKGASAYYVNHQPHAADTFKWQRGYGVLSFGGRSLQTVVAYIHNQKQHHQQYTTIAIYERLRSEG